MTDMLLALVLGVLTMAACFVAGASALVALVAGGIVIAVVGFAYVTEEKP